MRGKATQHSVSPNRLRSFHDHFHLARHLYERLSGGDALTFRIGGDSERVQSSLEVSDPERTMRFMVVMRRFLSPSKDLYFKAFWSVIREDCARELGHSSADSRVGRDRFLL
jgi:hypothetical protein